MKKLLIGGIATSIIGTIILIKKRVKNTNIMDMEVTFTNSNELLESANNVQKNLEDLDENLRRFNKFKPEFELKNKE